MPKINQEEYEMLKDLDNKWKWIARNYNGALIIYTSKPMENPNLYWDGFGKRMDDRLFQSIQWEDEEPYNIAELIEEYEDNYKGSWGHAIEFSKEVFEESEEKEVKDLEWAIKEIKNLETEESQNYPHDKMIEQEVVLGILKQIDQGANQTYKDGYDQGHEHGYSKGVYVGGGKEVETLSQDWIDNHTDKFVGNEGHRFVSTNDLQNLLVPRQEATIGKEDAENIVQYKEMGWTLSHLINDYGEDARHDELLAKAWLAYPNIEVEEEPKYYAKIKGWENVTTGSERFNWVYFKEKDTVGVSKAIENKYQTVSFTKNEWENLGITDDNAEFELVEELEE